MSTCTFGVVVFPGSNCDRDVAVVTQGLLGCPTRLIWYTETDLSGIDVVVLPGGFSYGDYLRCGAIARFSPIVRAIQAHATRGGYVLGICNGWQILLESGLLPGALVRNQQLQFVCERVGLTLERSDLIWTQAYGDIGSQIHLPIAHGEGRYYCDDDTLKQLEDRHQIVWRYCDGGNGIANPNGSTGAIAGICNSAGTILGMMPHPERAVDSTLNRGEPGQCDGLALWMGASKAISAAANLATA